MYKNKGESARVRVVCTYNEKYVLKIRLKITCRT